jgi:hypothetical protein
MGLGQAPGYAVVFLAAKSLSVAPVSPAPNPAAMNFAKSPRPWNVGPTLAMMTAAASTPAAVAASRAA